MGKQSTSIAINSVLGSANIFESPVIFRSNHQYIHPTLILILLQSIMRIYCTCIYKSLFLATLVFKVYLLYKFSAQIAFKILDCRNGCIFEDTLLKVQFSFIFL